MISPYCIVFDIMMPQIQQRLHYNDFPTLHHLHHTAFSLQFHLAFAIPHRLYLKPLPLPYRIALLWLIKCINPRSTAPCTLFWNLSEITLKRILSWRRRGSARKSVAICRTWLTSIGARIAEGLVPHFGWLDNSGKIILHYFPAWWRSPSSSGVFATTSFSHTQCFWPTYHRLWMPLPYLVLFFAPESDWSHHVRVTTDIFWSFSTPGLLLCTCQHLVSCFAPENDWSHTCRLQRGFSCRSCSLHLDSRC